jgi:hypothetical protein
MELLGQCTVEYRLNNFDTSCPLLTPEERDAESKKQQEQAREVLPWVVVAGGLILLCVVTCVPIATGLGLAAGSGSVAAAATAFCAEACPATFEVITFGCGVAGACFGPEIAGAAAPGYSRSLYGAPTAAERAAGLEKGPGMPILRNGTIDTARPHHRNEEGLRDGWLGR